MRFLFVHQSFPGQYLHLIRHLAAMGHEIVFICVPSPNRIPGVRLVLYPKTRPAEDNVHAAARDLDAAMRRAAAVANTAALVKQGGFTPDIIIGHHGWGEMLNLPDVWPDTPMLGYFEFYYRTRGADVGFDPEFPTLISDYPIVRSKNALNLLAFDMGQHGQTPTNWQHSTYPAWAKPSISLVPEGVNIGARRPVAARKTLHVGGMTIKPRDKLVTYVARDLEPYRGFHIMMRAIPRLLRARLDIRVLLVGGDGVSYGQRHPDGPWRQIMLEHLGGAIDPARVAFPGRVERSLYLDIMQRSDAHVYLTYPFVASWSLREALAMGCAIVASDTAPVTEFVRHSDTGLLVPCLNPEAVAEAVLRLLEDKALAHRLRASAARYAASALSITAHLESYQRLISQVTAQSSFSLP